MPLPLPEYPREPLHTRSIRVESFERPDGQWDLEAELIDTKSYDFPVRGGEMHRAGDPVHHMHVRVTIDDSFTITDALVVYDAAPYGEFCSAIAPDYRNLVGLNLLRQFRQHVKERFGRTAGCTHVTELTYVLPTVAVQTMAARRRKVAQEAAAQSTPERRPFQLDGCHALRVDGPVAMKFYPKWYEPPVVADEAPLSPANNPFSSSDR